MVFTQRFVVKIKTAVAALTSFGFLFSTVAAPVAEANFWQERRQAADRSNRPEEKTSPLYARLPGAMELDLALPSVTPSLAGALSSASTGEIRARVASSVRASDLPAWLRRLPSSAGEIRRVRLTKNPGKSLAVVLIQDVHDVVSAQKNIAQILSHIDAAAGGEKVMVGVEGAVGKFDLAPYRAQRIFKGHPLTCEILLNNHLIAAPEFFAFQSENEPFLWGIETPADYIENVSAYRAGHPLVPAVERGLSEAGQALAHRSSAIFSPDLKTLEATLSGYAKGTVPFSDYIRALAGRIPVETQGAEVSKLLRALDMESRMDFARVERERTDLIQALAQKLDPASLQNLLASSLAYRAGNLTYSDYFKGLKSLTARKGLSWKDFPAFDRYVEYVLLSESIDKFALFDQVDALKAKAQATAAKTDQERALMSLAEDLRLLDRLVRNEFGPAEWHSYQARRPDLSRLNERLFQALGGKTVRVPAPETLAVFERFYQAADKRNQSLSENLLAKARESKSRVLVMIAGGFHTPALEKALETAGASVVTVTPQVGDLPKDARYLDFFVAKHVPLEKMLVGERLYVAPYHGISEPIQVPGEGLNRGPEAVGALAAAVEAVLGGEAARQTAESGLADRVGIVSHPNGIVEATADRGTAEVTVVAGPTIEAIAALARGKGYEGKILNAGNGGVPVAVITSKPQGVVDSSLAAFRRFLSRFMDVARGAGRSVFASVVSAGERFSRIRVGSPPAGMASRQGGMVNLVTSHPEGKVDLNSLQRSVKGLMTDYEKSQRTNTLEGWLEDAPFVYIRVLAFIEQAEAFEKKLNADPAQAGIKEVAQQEILKGVSAVMELPQMSYAIPSEMKKSVDGLQGRLSGLAIRVGTSIERSRVDAIEDLFLADKALAAQQNKEGVRAMMGRSHITHSGGGAKIETLYPDDFSPYESRGQIWAPYMTVAMVRALIIKSGLKLDEAKNVMLPADVDKDIVDFVVEAVARQEGSQGWTADQRLQAYAKYEGEAFKSPEQTLVVAKAIGDPVASFLGRGETLSDEEREVAMKKYLDFCASFRRAMNFLKIRELWADKRGHLDPVALQAVKDVKGAFLPQELAENGLDDETLTMRVVALHQAWEVLSLAARGRMPLAANFKPRVTQRVLKKAMELVALAGGMASRWNDSLRGLVKEGLLRTVPEGPRQVAVHWLPGFSGIGLLLDSLATKGGGRLSTVVSPFTWIDIMKEIYRGRSAAGNEGKLVSVHTILQNPGEALKLDSTGHFLFDEQGKIQRVDGKVLGHGNVRGAAASMLKSLAEGTPYGLWRAGDGPLAQIGLSQMEEVRDRMVVEAEKGAPLAHVAIANWRTVGQLGGGAVAVEGTPSLYDTLIPNTPNRNGFVPNKDITMFSTFENAINYASFLYAVSGGINIENRPLMTWTDYVAVSALNQRALYNLSIRLAKLTPDQVLQITDRFINLLPSEYVEKKDGDATFWQPEQISGMWHGVLPEAVKARMMEDPTRDKTVPVPANMNLVYVDISLNEVEILSKGTKKYTGPVPSFAEVKSAPGLYAILESVQQIIVRAAKDGLFSNKVLEEAQRTLPRRKEAGFILGYGSFLPLGILAALAMAVMAGGWADPVGLWEGMKGLLDLAGSWTGFHFSAGDLAVLAVGSVAPGLGQVLVQDSVSRGTTPKVTQELPKEWLEAVQRDLKRKGFEIVPREKAAASVLSYLADGMAYVRSVTPGQESQEFDDSGTFRQALQTGRVVVFLHPGAPQNPKFYWAPNATPGSGKQGGFLNIGVFIDGLKRLLEKFLTPKPSADRRSLYERAGGRPLWDQLIPRVQPQLGDLQVTAMDLMNQTVRELDGLGELAVPLVSKAAFEGTAVQALLTASLAQNANPTTVSSFAGQVKTTLGKFAKTIFGETVGNELTRYAGPLFALTKWSDPVGFVAIGEAKSGVLEEYLITEHTVPDMLENVLDETERLADAIREGQVAPREAPVRVILVKPEARERFSPELLARLTALKGPSIKIIEWSATADESDLAQQVTRSLDGIHRAARTMGLTVKMITDAPTASLLKEQGFDQTTAELLIWIMAGTAVPVTEGIENGVRSILAALKNA
ncbi:MAG: hypothetical protein IPP35_03550 [Elusimicrobia bacterium]|nr:hypothetical protein [Elusimicrobiota bacterium]